MLKTPLTYYGGKQTMLPHILPLFPEHWLYTEAFAGGAAVFWSKEPSPVEVINDKNGELMNFYEVVKTRLDELAEAIDATLHSRRAYVFAGTVYNNPEFFDEIKRAWAVWTLCNQGFAGQIGKSWGYGRKPTERNTDAITLKTANKRISLQEKDEHGLFVLAERLKMVQLECNDAVKVIQTRDCKWAFHYVDPPYLDCNQGQATRRRTSNACSTRSSRWKASFCSPATTANLSAATQPTTAGRWNDTKNRSPRKRFSTAANAQPK